MLQDVVIGNNTEVGLYQADYYKSSTNAGYLLAGPAPLTIHDLNSIAITPAKISATSRLRVVSRQKIGTFLDLLAGRLMASGFLWLPAGNLLYIGNAF